jgi:hypothetical protein
MSTTKTPNHTITRSSEKVFFGIADNAPKTTVTDNRTHARGEGLGRTQGEADQRAWDRLHSANESKKR